jgi:hypothetical protein
MNSLMTRGTTLGLLTTLAAATFSPAALADSRQKNKNDWRNLGYLGAAVAGYGLLNHNTTATVLGAAGAAYSVNRYEQDRHSQSQAQARRDRYFYRNGSRYNYPTLYRRSSHVPNGNAYGDWRHHDK